jgi:hypothetical protein
MGEIASAEWEVVEENEWNAARQSGNGSNNVRGSCTDPLIFTNAHSNPHQSNGTSGWTKLRTR